MGSSLDDNTDSIDFEHELSHKLNECERKAQVETGKSLSGGRRSYSVIAIKALSKDFFLNLI